MKLTKFCAFSTAILAASLAFADAENVYMLFSTVGPDKYADGITVLDGERYALVAVPKGQDFGGFNADCTATREGDKVLTIAPFAKGGRLTLTLFQADKADATGKDLKVFLLDTRTSKYSVPAFETPASDLVLNGAVEITDASVEAKAGVVAITGNSSLINPTIEDFEIDGDKAKITVGNVRPGLNYQVQCGLDRSGTIEHETTVNDDGTITLTVDKDEAAFFSVTAQ